MISFDSIQELYDNQEFEKCLQSADTFLLFDNKNADVLLLKAKCEYYLASNAEHEEIKDPVPLFQQAYKSFEAVLSLRPEDEDALQYAAYICIYILEDKIHEAIGYCNRLQQMTTNANRMINAINYRIKAYFILGEADKLLSDISILESLCKSEFVNDRPALDSWLNDLFLTKGDVYLNLKHDIPNALSAYKDGLQYAYPAREADIDIAMLAFSHKEFALGTEMYANVLLTGFRGDTVKLMDLYKQALDLLNNEYRNERLFYVLMVTMRQLKEDYFGKDYALEIFALSKQFMHSNPEWFMPYHYAGTILFEADKYTEALAYFKKALQHPGGLAFTIYRYIVSSWYAEKVIPEIASWPVDRADEYYSAGVCFNEFEEEADDIHIKNELLLLRKAFYEKSYNSFYDYFYKGIGRNLSDDIHTFAMCCNNFGIVLTELGEYEKAIEVHRQGYSLSPFWEQQFSLGAALRKSGKDEEALEAFMEAIDTGVGFMSMENYLETRGYIMELLLKFNRIDEVSRMLEIVENEYKTFVIENKGDLSENELSGIDRFYINIQNVRAGLLEQTATTADSIEVWKKELEKNPDDTSAWFMLFQHYFTENDYKQCIACADNYQILKGDQVSVLDNCKVHYFRGKSYQALGDFEKAIENYKFIIKEHQGGERIDSSSEAGVYEYLTECYYSLNKWTECRKYGWEAIQCYHRHDWAWDEHLIQIMLKYADACYAEGIKDAARGTIDNILKVAPENVEALRRKEEWKKNWGGFLSIFKKKNG